MDVTGRRAVTTLPSDTSAVAAARSFASRTLVDFGRTEDLIDKAKLLVTELTTNAVLYAHSPIRLTVGAVDDRVRVEVRDDDPEPLDSPSCPPPEAENGRGLWMVSALAASWGVNRNARGKTVWFEVD